MKKVILLTEGLSTYARDLLKGMSEYSRLKGPWAFYRESMIPFYRSTKNMGTLKHLKALKADGIIIRSTGPEMTQEALDLNLPMIACDDNNLIPEVPNVMSDYQAVGTIAAEHMLARGFQHYAYCGFDDMHWSVERGRFFKNIIEKAGYQVNTYVSPKRKKNQLWEKELPLLTQWIASLPKPVAIMACNDDRANQVIICCNLMNIYIPEEVAVLGVDNDSLLCDLSNPHLSSIALNNQKAGYKAAELLDKIISGESPKEQTIYVGPTHIVSRRSTDILAVDDRDIVEAIQFIRKNARMPIQVCDVADAVALSNRTLYSKFHKYLGRSVYDEIKRVRIEEISQMLLSTDLPVYQIAQCFHFSSVEHIARYFKNATNMSPLAYRKKYGTKSARSFISD